MPSPSPFCQRVSNSSTHTRRRREHIGKLWRAGRAGELGSAFLHDCTRYGPILLALYDSVLLPRSALLRTPSSLRRRAPCLDSETSMAWPKLSRSLCPVHDDRDNPHLQENYASRFACSSTMSRSIPRGMLSMALMISLSRLSDMERSLSVEQDWQHWFNAEHKSTSHQHWSALAPM